jgi:hypothetical protein
MKTLLKDALSGLYYSRNHAWADDVSAAMQFDSINAAAATAVEERLETAEVVLRYEDPLCELKLPVRVCLQDAATAARPRARRGLLDGKTSTPLER